MQASKDDAERESFMHYVADSLHYAPQGMYYADKWGESAPVRDYDPMEIIESVASRAGIEVRM